jgi:hypothetical protein
VDVGVLGGIERFDLRPSAAMAVAAAPVILLVSKEGSTPARREAADGAGSVPLVEL